MYDSSAERMKPPRQPALMAGVSATLPADGPEMHLSPSCGLQADLRAAVRLSQLLCKRDDIPTEPLGAKKNKWI